MQEVTGEEDPLVTTHNINELIVHTQHCDQLISCC